MLIDSHAHITAEQFLEEERGEILQHASNQGVQAILNIATNVLELEQSIVLSPPPTLQLLRAAATTPHEASFEDPFYAIVEEAVLSGKLDAIGETGLDYYYEHSPRDAQAVCLERYLALATKAAKPLVIHCRNAFQDLFSIFKRKGGAAKTILHCFTGTLEEAKELIDLGFLISFSGIITYPKSLALQEIVKQIPLDSFLVETDSPYLAPQGFRGKRCEPALIKNTYACIAALRGIDQMVLEESVKNNFYWLFPASKASTID